VSTGLYNSGNDSISQLNVLCCHCCRVIDQLEEQLKNAQLQLADHVTQLGVANKMVSVLQEQLVVSRKEQAEMKNELVQLREENSLLHDSLKNIQQVSL